MQLGLGSLRQAGWRAWHSAVGSNAGGDGSVKNAAAAAGEEGRQGAATPPPPRCRLPCRLTSPSGRRDPTRGMLAAWAEEEGREHGVMPLRVSSEFAAEGDPERVVMSDDLLPSLVRLETTEAQADLFTSAASLLGVPGAFAHLLFTSTRGARICYAETPEALLPLAPTDRRRPSQPTEVAMRPCNTLGCASSSQQMRGLPACSWPRRTATLRSAGWRRVDCSSAAPRRFPCGSSMQRRRARRAIGSRGGVCASPP